MTFTMSPHATASLLVLIRRDCNKIRAERVINKMQNIGKSLKAFLIAKVDEEITLMSV